MLIDPDKIRVGSFVTRDSSDLHEVMSIDTPDGFSITVRCVAAPETGWCDIGAEESNLAKRYSLMYHPGEWVKLGKCHVPVDRNVLVMHEDRPETNLYGRFIDGIFCIYNSEYDRMIEVGKTSAYEPGICITHFLVPPRLPKAKA
jgi:hypothetical protein